MPAYLELVNLTKRFGRTAAVDGVSLSIPRGDILALLGPSGSGKTTTLRLLAGFELPDVGRILVDGEDTTDRPPARRHFGMVFQHYALFPHLDVGANVGFGLESRGIAPADRARRVAQALALVDLAGFERRAVGSLSGGQQQRVALARAIAPEPRVLLLDEPLSNLDPTLRERTRRELRELIARIGITTILVTHEQEEAFDLADHVALLRAGRLEQVGTPEELYHEPRTAFVAGFVGRSSAVPVRIVSVEDSVAAVLLPGATAPWRVPHPGALTGASLLHVRPEAVGLTAAEGAAVRGAVVARRFLGASALFTVQIGDGVTLEVQSDPAGPEVGDTTGVAPSGPGLHLFPAEAP